MMNQNDWAIYRRFPARNVYWLAMKLLGYSYVGNSIMGGFHRDGTIYWFEDDGTISVSRDDE